MQQLQKDEIKIKNCRLQCYDNAAAMAGHRNGVQQRIYEKTNRQCLLTVTIIHLTWWVFMPLDMTQKWFFFGDINSLYNFFSCSTQVGKN